MSGQHMADIPKAFGEIRTANITRDPRHGIGAWTDGELAYLLRTGIKRDGRFAPIMLQFPELSDEDVYSIIAFLRSDDPLTRPVSQPAPRSTPSLMARFFIRFLMKPADYPAHPVAAPDAGDPVAFGRYLTRAKFDCAGCHTKTFAGGEELVDSAGQPVFTANLTPHPTGLLAWTAADFERAVRGNRGRDGRLLRVMPMFSGLSDAEVDAMYAYLRTVEPVEKVREGAPPAEPLAVAMAEGGDGARLYAKYMCQSCHGTSGLGSCDLRGAAGKYTDAQMADFIRNPARTAPGSKMPGWEGVIAEHEYAPLAAYVRALGEGRMGGVTTASR
jgi:mono/diheme cytochrome c family protein